MQGRDSARAELNMSDRECARDNGGSRESDTQKSTELLRAPKQKVFAKEYRLRTRQHLRYVKEKGSSRAGKRCVVSVATPLDEQRRLATIISRRYSLKAVVRNRARRLLREAYRILLPELKPAWIVLIPRRYMQTAKLSDVLPELRRLFHELGVLNSPGKDVAEESGQ